LFSRATVPLLLLLVLVASMVAGSGGGPLNGSGGAPVVAKPPGAGHEAGWIAEHYDGHAATGNTTEWVYEQEMLAAKAAAAAPPMAKDSMVNTRSEMRYEQPTGMSQQEAAGSSPGCKEVLENDWNHFKNSLGKASEKVTSESIKDFIVARLPVFDWVPKYSMQKFAKDLQAGLVVGCMLIPQGMGYADVAGLPFVAGLYSGFAPLIVYAMFGTSRQMGVGPVAIVSLLVASGVPACNVLCPDADGNIPEDPYPVCPETCEREWVTNQVYWDYTTICSIMVGVIQVFFAPLLGFVMNFVPHPVISGFTSAGGCIIAMSQLKDVMGYKIHKDKLQQGIYDFFAGLPKTHWQTCVMGCTAAVTLLFFRKLGQGKIFFWTPKKPVPRPVKLVAKLPWAFILVIIYTVASYLLRVDQYGVKITGAVPKGLPAFSLPPKLIESFPKLISIVIQIVIIGYLESIAVETKFATQLGYKVQPAQEGFALGVANLIAGMTQAYPVVGSFSRSATNASYESQSPLCNLITGVVIMLTLIFLTPLFYYMPKNVLAAIVIVAATSLVDLHEPVFLWRSSKKEFFLLVVTFGLTAFVALEMGIYVAVSLCGIEVLFKSTRPKVVRLSEKVLLIYLPGAAGIGRGDTEASLLPSNLQGSDILVCRVEGDLTFSAASALKNIISDHFKQAVESRELTALVFDFRELEIVDTTALNALIALVEEIEQRSIAVFIVGMPSGLLRFLEIASVKEKLKRVDLKDDFGQVHHSLRPVFEEAGDHEEQQGLVHDENARQRRYQQTLEHAISAAIREDGVCKRTRRSGDYVRSISNPFPMDGACNSGHASGANSRGYTPLGTPRANPDNFPATVGELGLQAGGSAREVGYASDSAGVRGEAAPRVLRQAPEEVAIEMAQSGHRNGVANGGPLYPAQPLVDEKLVEEGFA